MKIRVSKKHKNKWDLSTQINKKTRQLEYAWEPISKKNGQDWLKWRKELCKYGYRDDWREMNSADFGAFTSRNRLFGIFAKGNLPISWPKPTHAPKKKLAAQPAVQNDLFAGLEERLQLQPYKAVKEVLDFYDEGESIFDNLYLKTRKTSKQYLLKNDKSKNVRDNKTIVIFPVSAVPKDRTPVFGMEPKLVLKYKDRNKFDEKLAKFAKKHKCDETDLLFYRHEELSDKTKERVYKGLIKFVAGGKDNFEAKLKAFSDNLHHYSMPVDQPVFLTKPYSGRPEGKNISVDGPAATITTFGGGSLVQPQFLSKGFSGNPDGLNIPVDGPAGTITTIDHHQLVQPEFLIQRNSGNPDSKVISTDGPARTLTSTGGNQHLVKPCYVGRFLSTYNGGRPDSRNIPLDVPCKTITTENRHALVTPSFIHAYYSNGDNNHSTEGPCPTLRTKDGAALVQPCYLLNYNHSSSANSLIAPSPTIMAADKLGIVSAQFIKRDFSNGGESQSIDSPAGAVMPVPKMHLINCVPYIMGTHYGNEPTSINDPLPVITAGRKWHYIINPSWGGNPGDVNEPCPVVVARQDKAPLYLVLTKEGYLAIEIYESDSEITRHIKEFMGLYGIVDIKMRMLKIIELLKIQDFPVDYILEGTQADQKKFIGNSVVPRVVKRWALSLHNEILNYNLKVA